MSYIRRPSILTEPQCQLMGIVEIELDLGTVLW